MLFTTVPGPTLSRRLQLTTLLTAKTLLVLIAVAFAASMLSTLAHAQGSLSLGTVQEDPTSAPCPSGSGWYFYKDANNVKHPMTCATATIAGNCVTKYGDASLGFMYGYLSPAGYIQGISASNVKGVIVFLTGAGGTTPAGDETGASNGDFEFADDYFRAGYEVVQIAWNTSWEMTQNPFSSPLNPPPYGNIQYAACRPATFLDYIYNHIYVASVYNSVTNPTAGMCVQGSSAGSAAAAYSLAYYGLATEIDNAELLSGPPLSDVNQGCEEPNTNTITICGTGDSWCQLGTSGSWSFSPTYLAPAYNGVQQWTNDGSCAVPNTTTLSSSSAHWLLQSIVDTGSGGPSPTFVYPHTSMAGWLCRTVYNPNNINCQTNYDPDYCMNNTSPQGELFYDQVGAQQSQPPFFNVYAVNLCMHAEGVAGGYVGSGTGPTGLSQIEQEMLGSTATPPIPAQCVRQH